ncbi:putative NACHT [Triplophysa rosa]|uniref:NACHT n=1 Tax=Triplophysa rosa TaxID=992332 RepID=A0A9W7WKA2_TRIRA|nr:putative NACHT [Triplophysa rosa]
MKSEHNWSQRTSGKPKTQSTDKARDRNMGPLPTRAYTRTTRHKTKGLSNALFHRSDSPEPSCLSVKSDQFMPVELNGGDLSSDESSGERLNSSVPGVLSMKSDKSMTMPIHLKHKESLLDQSSGERLNSSVPGVLSMKSDKSMTMPIHLKHKESLLDQSSGERLNSSVPGVLSMKSDKSMTMPIHLKHEESLPDQSSGERFNSSVPSVLSLKSDKSMSTPIHLHHEESLPDPSSSERFNSNVPSVLSMKSDKSMAMPMHLKHEDSLPDQRMTTFLTLGTDSDNEQKLLTNCADYFKYTAGLQDTECGLESLKLKDCGVTEDGCVLLSTALSLNLSHLRELDLSWNPVGNSGVKHLCAVLKKTECALQILKLNTCGITEEICAALASALSSKTSGLIELDLSVNALQDSGVKLISAGLKNSHCQLKILRLSNCSVTKEGVSALAEALNSNPSHLTELDLRDNRLKQSDVNLLSTIQDKVIT